METGRPTIVKAIIWNLIGLISMAVVGYLATGSVVTGGAVALVGVPTGLTAYVIYERVRGRIGWGYYGR